MKNLKFLSLALLFWVLVIAWCEKANNQEKVSCEGDEVCSVEDTLETPSLEIEETPTVIVEADDLEWDFDWNWEWLVDVEWNLEWDLDSHEGEAISLQDFETTIEDSVDAVEEPIMDLMVDENVITE